MHSYVDQGGVAEAVGCKSDPSEPMRRYHCYKRSDKVES